MSPKGVADFTRIHPDGNEGGDGQKDAGCRQPSFDAADFAGTDGSPLPPQKPVSQRLKWQSDTTHESLPTILLAGSEEEQAELAQAKSLPFGAIPCV